MFGSLLPVSSLVLIHIICKTNRWYQMIGLMLCLFQVSIGYIPITTSTEHSDRCCQILAAEDIAEELVSSGIHSNKLDSWCWNGPNFGNMSNSYLNNSKCMSFNSSCVSFQRTTASRWSSGVSLRSRPIAHRRLLFCVCLNAFFWPPVGRMKQFWQKIYLCKQREHHRTPVLKIKLPQKVLSCLECAGQLDEQSRNQIITRCITQIYIIFLHHTLSNDKYHIL